MTGAKWTRDLLKEEWDENSDFCEEPVPEPNITVEGDVEKRSVHYGDSDVVFTKDGDVQQVQAQSLGYQEQRVETVVDIEIITSKGRDRLWGYTGEEYGGLQGEVERIIDKYRLGVTDDAPMRDPGYNVIVKDVFDDQIGDRKGDMWAGTWTITFITYADGITQKPVSQVND